MNNLLSIESTMPVEASDSPLGDHLTKRGHINVSSDATPSHIYYELYGSGPNKIVFINGMGADRQMWEPDVGEFLRHARYQCLVFDHRGTGFSDSAGGPLAYTSSSLAEDTRRLVDALGWDKINVVGASMGGMIALELACTHPDLIATLTLVVTHAGMTIPPLRGIMDSVAANFVSDPFVRFKRICGSLYPQEFLDSAPPPEAEARGCRTMLDYCADVAVRRSKYTKPMSLATFVGQVGVVFRHYVAPARLELLGKMLPDHQILIVTGDQDHLVRTSNSAYLADTIGRDKVTFEVYEGTGHGLHSQQAHRLVQSIDAMISRVCGSATEQSH
ncbi:hypothetical protein IW150_000847 [Coemansia sp. RSA 2607]|nr:hypothetical protein IW150_000847 [Coemansia sp. RSA 2607]